MLVESAKSLLFTVGGGNHANEGGGGEGKGAGGDMSEIEAMKEKIRLLELQLAREKAARVVTQAPPHHSPAHTGLVYTTSGDTYPPSQVQQYAATQVQVNHLFCVTDYLQDENLSLSLGLAHAHKVHSHRKIDWIFANVFPTLILEKLMQF